MGIRVNKEVFAAELLPLLNGLPPGINKRYATINKQQMFSWDLDGSIHFFFIM